MKTAPRVKMVEKQSGLKEDNIKLDLSAKGLAVQKALERKTRGSIARDAYALSILNGHVRRILKKTGIASSDPQVALEIPASDISADFTLKAPNLTKYCAEKNPQVLAQKISEAISSDSLLGLNVQDIEVIDFYININFDRKYLSKLVLQNISDLGERYGENDTFDEQRFLVDYSSPNTAKRMTIGHIRSTVIGGSIVRILDASGATVYGINHLGDWGKQFGLLSLAMEMEEKKGDQNRMEGLEDNPIEVLGDLYVEVSQAAKTDPATNEEARKRFFALETGDPEQLKRWKELRDWSLMEFERMYKRMGISFDMYLGESFYEGMLDAVLKDCLKHKLAYENEDGSIIVPFKKNIGADKSYYIDKSVTQNPELQQNVTKENGYEVLLLRKNDGSSLYSTRDLAALRYRKETFGLDHIVYVVGNEQHSYLLQCFELARELGYIRGAEPLHVGFGLIKQAGEKMSSRKGNVFRLEELFNCAKNKILDIFKADENHADIDECLKEQAAEDIAVGAVIFGDLAQSREKDVEFNLEKILNMKEMSGPYIQYAAVRCESILDRIRQTGAEFLPIDDAFWSEIDSKDIQDHEWKLIKELSIFPEVVATASKNLTPHCIATYLFKLAQTFNVFYSQTNVLHSEGYIRTFRIKLVQSVQLVIRNGLRLLCIKTPAMM